MDWKYTEAVNDGLERAAQIAEGTLAVDSTMTEAEREAFRLGVQMAAANIRLAVISGALFGSEEG